MAEGYARPRSRRDRRRPSGPSPSAPRPGSRLAFLAPAVTRCSAPCWRPSYSAPTVSSVSISSARLVGPEARDPREPQREAGLVAVATARSRRRRPRRRPSARPAGSGRSGRSCASSNQRVISAISASVRPLYALPIVTSRSCAVVADGERVVRQDAVALAVADLDADDDAVDRRERLLHLQPAEAAPAGRVDRLAGP